MTVTFRAGAALGNSNSSIPSFNIAFAPSALTSAGRSITRKILSEQTS